MFCAFVVAHIRRLYCYLTPWFSNMTDHSSNAMFIVVEMKRILEPVPLFFHVLFSSVYILARSANSRSRSGLAAYVVVGTRIYVVVGTRVY